MASEVELAVKNQVSSFRDLIAQNPGDGSYYISDISSHMATNESVRMLNLLFLVLTKEFPEYEWSTSEPLFGVGITVRWRRK